VYRIIGGDQKEYGPVSADEIQLWIEEGRANGQTQVRDEDGPWRPLSTIPEFAEVLSRMVRPPPPARLPTGRPATQTNGMAVAGLVMGLFSVSVGIFCCVPFFPVLGIVFSAIALAQTKKNPGVQSGRGMAIAGLVLSAMGLIFSLFVIMLLGFFRGLAEALGGR
jgi:membrane-associated protease RseP (regulator of RpoE activity)